MSLAIKVALLILSVSVISVLSAPLDRQNIADFQDPRLSNFSSFWRISSEITEKCKSSNSDLYMVGLCSSYYSILVQIHEKNLGDLEHKADLEIIVKEEDFCEKFIDMLPATSPIQSVKTEVEKFKRRNGKVTWCEKTCKNINWETEIPYTIDLCKLVYFGYSELSKTGKEAIQAYAAPAHSNVSVNPAQSLEPAQNVLLVDLSQLTTKAPVGSVINHNAEGSTKKTEQVREENVQETYIDQSISEKSMEVPKNRNYSAQKLPEVIPPSIKTVVTPPKKEDLAPQVTPPVKVNPLPEKTKAEEEADKTAKDMNTKNEINIQDVNGIDVEGEAEDDKTKGTEASQGLEGDGVAGDENLEEDTKLDYPEDPDIDDSLNRDNNNRDDSVSQKIPPRHSPVEPVEHERPQHKQPYEDSEESPRKKEVIADPFMDETDSNFFTYFIIIMFSCILSYVIYHNKSKILALLLEGRRGSGSGRGGRRKHTAAYRKLDSNLEEALLKNSGKPSNTPEIIY